MTAVVRSGAPDRLPRGEPAGAPPHFAQVLPLKRGGPEPLYYQLAQSLEHAVETDAISPGARLLSEKDMAEELSLAVSTVRRAWAYLERKGLLTRTRKAGTFIR